MKQEKMLITPAFDHDNVAVVLTSSAYYAPFMSITVQSIIRTSRKEHNYDIIVFQKEIPEIVKHKIADLAKGLDNISIRFFDVSKEIDRHNFNFRPGYSTESFYCVLLHELLPLYDKIIYMDCDVVVMADIAELYQVDVENHLLAAAHEPEGMGRAVLNYDNDGRREYMLNTMHLKSVGDYFQSGVMLFNLKKFRETFTIDQILEVACAPYIWFGDQDVLNILCRGKIQYINMEWNMIVYCPDVTLEYLLKDGPEGIWEEYKEARRHPKIIHYAATKPWKAFFCDLFPFFWEVALETPFYKEIRQSLLREQNMNPFCSPDCYKEKVLEQYENRQIGLKFVLKFFLAWLYGKIRRARPDSSCLACPKETACAEPEELFSLPANGAPLVSVIVSSRNTEDYISACLSSLLRQKLESMEILVIDNASNDSTPDIIRQFAGYSSMIRPIFLDKDIGPSGARNLGITKARGEYLIFCDSDDTVPCGAYKKMLCNAKKNHADAVVGNFWRILPDGEKRENILSGRNTFEDCLSCSVVWNKMIRRSMIVENEITFDETIQHFEDILFTTSWLQLNPYIVKENSLIYEHLEVRSKDVKKEQLTSRVTLTRARAQVHMVETVFSQPIKHHIDLWKHFYLDQLCDFYRQIWSKMPNEQDKRESFDLMKRLVALGEERKICKWIPDESWGYANDVFGMNGLTFLGMPYDDYMLFLNLRNLSHPGGAPDSEFSFDSKERTLWMFRNGQVGFRYIACYFKAWLKFKLKRK